jgi:ABC-2 type transport system permease protein
MSAMFHRLLKNELLKLFGKKRTYIGFGAFLLVQVLMLLLFRFGHIRAQMERMLEGNGYLPKNYISALTVAVIMLIPQVSLLMPLYAALVGGDMVAKEAEDGTLRMILSRPVSRFRLLLMKWLAGVVFSAVLVLVLGGMALCLARIWFPWGDMFVTWPGIGFNVLAAGTGFKLFLWSLGFMAVNATVVLGFAFMFSCFNMKPAAATILSLSVLFISMVMENVQFFQDYKEWFPTYHFHTWIRIYSQPTPWDSVGTTLCVLLALDVTTFLVGLAAFQARDIKC